MGSIVDPGAANADADKAGVADDDVGDVRVLICGDYQWAADADADLADDADNEDDADGVHIRGVRPGAWQQPSTGLLKDRPKRQQLNALINSVLLVVKEK